jgi:DNA-binding transcriptional ArsR family regulator
VNPHRAFRHLPLEILARLASGACDPSRRPRLINPDNSGGDLVSWDQALDEIQNGATFAGVVREDILAIDVDLRVLLPTWVDRALDELCARQLESLREVDDDFEVASDEARESVRRRLALSNIATELATRGLSPVMVRSGRPGHRHLFCAVSDPEVRGQMAEAAADAGLDNRHDHALIRPPGWPHRQGYEISVASIGRNSYSGDQTTSPRVWLAAAAALDGREASAVVRLASPPSTRQPTTSSAQLPERLWQMIHAGDVDRRYTKSGGTDRSALTLVICNLAVVAGVHQNHLWNLLVDRRNKGGEGLRSRIEQRGLDGRNGARAWFETLWKKANDGKERSVFVKGRAQSVWYIHQLESLAQESTFAGASGSTDYAVLGACHELGRSWGSRYVPLPTRQVSLEAGVSAATAGRSLKRLQASGWLSLVRVSKEDRSAVYRLTAPPGTSIDQSTCPATDDDAPTLPIDEGSISERKDVRDSTSSSSLGGRRTDSLPHVRSNLRGHDAFHRLALGKGCLQTYETLGLLVSATARDVATRTAKHPNTVRRHLAELVAAGLVEHNVEGRWTLVDLASDEFSARLVDIAADMGTLGAKDRRAARYAEDRRNYQEWLIQRLEVALATGRLLPDGATQDRFALVPAPIVERHRRGPPLERVA